MAADKASKRRIRFSIGRQNRTFHIIKCARRANLDAAAFPFALAPPQSLFEGFPISRDLRKSRAGRRLLCARRVQRVCMGAESYWCVRWEFQQAKSSNSVAYSQRWSESLSLSRLAPNQQASRAINRAILSLTRRAAR